MTVTAQLGVATLTQKSGPEGHNAFCMIYLVIWTKRPRRYDVEYPDHPDHQQIIAFVVFPRPHLDHSQRIVNFALTLQALVQQLETRHTIKITLHGGIHSGPMIGSVLYKPKSSMKYGDSVATVGIERTRSASGSVAGLTNDL
ncbi:MAG: hypothetical protein R3E79_47470 [Caldilineaceae bacterium]